MITQIPTQTVEVLLSICVLASSAGLIVTAKDFYKVKEEVNLELSKLETDYIQRISDLKDSLREQFVPKELYQSMTDALKDDIQKIQISQRDVQVKIDKIYEFILNRG